MPPIDDFMLTREEREWMRRYEHHHRIMGATPPELDLGERRYQSRKLAELRQELPRCPHAWVIIGVFRFRGLMGAEDVQEILHLLPKPPQAPEPVKLKERIRNLEMKPKPSAQVMMAKKLSRKLDLDPEPPARGPIPRPRRRRLDWN